MNNKIIPLFLLMTALLSACGGSDVDSRQADPAAKDGDTDDGTLVDDGSFTNVSFLPLMTVELFSTWSGFTSDNVFRSYGKSPFITYYTINPVNASTLAPVTDAKASDFNMKEDGIPLNSKVNFPVLQKIVGNRVNLNTALVINTSSAMYGVERIAFIQEIKDYVSSSLASSNYYIANQQFTIWAFDGLIVEETFTSGGRTNDEADIHAALDRVLTNWENDTYGEVTGANHGYDAIVEAIGRLSASGPFDHTVELRDSNTLAADANDLVDEVTPDYIKLSNLVYFSAGYSATNVFNEEFVVKALESQSTYIYDVSQGPSSTTINLGKGLIYVIPDGGSEDDVIAAKSDAVIKDSLSNSAYNFSSSIIDAQVSAVQKRAVLDNQHVLRWSSSIRSGSGHSLEIATRTPEDKYSYTLSIDSYDVIPSNDAMPLPQVEITGVNDEYLAANDPDNAGAPYNSAIAFASQISTFYPAVRWTNQTFTSSDYTWSSLPADAITINANGSVSINSGATYPITLTLSNSNIEHQGSTMTDDFVLTIEEKL